MRAVCLRKDGGQLVQSQSFEPRLVPSPEDVKAQARLAKELQAEAKRAFAAGHHSQRVDEVLTRVAGERSKIKAYVNDTAFEQRLIETLYCNAEASGIARDDVECKIITDEEFSALMLAFAPKQE